MAITAVVHVDDIFAVGQKERCDRLCVDLNRTIPVKNLGDLKWYGGCQYSRDHKRGSCQEPRRFEVVCRMPILEGSQKGYSNDIPTEFRVRVGE